MEVAPAAERTRRTRRRGRGGGGGGRLRLLRWLGSISAGPGPPAISCLRSGELSRVQEGGGGWVEVQPHSKGRGGQRKVEGGGRDEQRGTRALHTLGCSAVRRPHSRRGEGELRWRSGRQPAKVEGRRERGRRGRGGCEAREASRCSLPPPPPPLLTICAFTPIAAAVRRRVAVVSLCVRQPAQTAEGGVDLSRAHLTAAETASGATAPHPTQHHSPALHCTAQHSAVYSTAHRTARSTAEQQSSAVQWCSTILQVVGAVGGQWVSSAVCEQCEQCVQWVQCRVESPPLSRATAPLSTASHSPTSATTLRCRSQPPVPPSDDHSTPIPVRTTTAVPVRLCLSVPSSLTSSPSPPADVTCASLTTRTTATLAGV